MFLAAGLALGDGAALVPLAASAGEAELDLGVASLEVELEGHDGEAALGGVAGEAVDFASVEEELAGALGVEVFLGGGFVGGYMEVVEPGVAALDAGRAFRLPALNGLSDLTRGLRAGISGGGWDRVKLWGHAG